MQPHSRREFLARVEKANSLFHRSQFDIEAVIPGRGRGYGEKHPPGNSIKPKTRDIGFLSDEFPTRY